MQIMLSIYLNSSTCKYLSLDNRVTMTSKRRENINLVSFICLSLLLYTTNKVALWSASYSACVVYTKTIIHLSVGESGGYLPRRLTSR